MTIKAYFYYQVTIEFFPYPSPRSHTVAKQCSIYSMRDVLLYVLLFTLDIVPNDYVRTIITYLPYIDHPLSESAKTNYELRC